MLYLTRKIGESVVINDEIEVTVVDIRGKSIKLGFTFPEHATVLRREIYERIQEENRAAAAGSEVLAEAFRGKSGAPSGTRGETGRDETGRDETGRGDDREPGTKTEPEVEQASKLKR